MSETLQEQTVSFVDASTKPVSGKALAPHRQLRLGRIIKLGLAGTLLTGTAVTILVGQGHVTADNAVVSAYVLSVRSPIQGQVSRLQLHVGDAVDGTTLLAHVFDERVSDERLVDLRSELDRGQSEFGAFEAQRNALIELRTTLAARSERYRTAQIAYTLASSNEAAANLLGGAFRLELARRDMGRKVSLGRSGDVPVAAIDRAALDAHTAETDVTSQTAHLAYQRAREAAAAQGIFLDAGASDVSYSTQRMDEINLRLTDVNRAGAGLAAGKILAEVRLAAEERRFAALSDAELRLSAPGMVWKLGVSNGERVSMGDTLAQVIDCEASFIVAAISQRDFSSVELGSLAQFRLSGETTDREGRVLSVTADSSISGDRNLAAAPVADRATTGVVRIEVPRSGNKGAECLVGRTARVLLPTVGGGMLARLLRWLA